MKTIPSARSKTNSSTWKTPAEKTNLSTRRSSVGENVEPHLKAAPIVYNPPTLGINPAYDEALKYIAEDKAKKYQQIKEIEQIIKKKIDQGRSFSLELLHLEAFIHPRNVFLLKDFLLMMNR